jgi:biopolymer transport protein ExbB
MEGGSELWDLAAKGGPIVAILGAFSVGVVAIVLVKLYQLAALEIRSRRFVGPALESFARGDVREALGGLETSRNPIARVMEAAIRGLHHARRDTAAVREEVSRVGTQQLARLESYLRGLETIGNLSPLLGLLGTVVGMIRAFRRLEEAGTRVDPAILSGGIWEALLTTAVGLAVAIPALLALSWLESEIERVRRDMGDVVSRVFTHSPDGIVAGESAERAPLGSEPQHAL